MKSAPIQYRYRLSRLSFGKATSLAPTMIGRTKFPSAPGTLGMMNRKTMIAPCSVKAWLYMWPDMKVFFGVRSSRRTSIAKNPPSANAMSVLTRYIRPMRLWSTVVSHDQTPASALM